MSTNPLYDIATSGSLIVINPSVLLDYLHKDRAVTYQEGFLAGTRAMVMLSKKDAAKMLDVSEGTIDNLRKSGELDSAEYCGQVHISREELERYIREHTGLYYLLGKGSKGNKSRRANYV